MHERENALKEWLEHILNTQQFVLTPLTGDASFRRYFRMQYNGISRVVMDAPPGKEDLKAFLQVTSLLAKADLVTPQIHAQNLEQGFLLLSDLGDALLLSQLNSQTADHYYKLAINMLFTMQDLDTTHLPPFDYTFMLKEMNLCTEWFLTAYLNLKLQKNEQQLLTQTFHKLAAEIANQPQVFIHRDYHSRNLMCTENQTLAQIDFQDAMIGPLPYDLVSLLKDCYIAWPRDQVLKWLRYFFDNSTKSFTPTFDAFVRAFDLCGLQRHLKILGVFSRLFLRDNKPTYLKDLPLTLNYVLECTELYKDFHPLFHFLQERVYLP